MSISKAPSDYSMSASFGLFKNHVKTIQSEFVMLKIVSNYQAPPGPMFGSPSFHWEHLGARSVSCWKATRCCCVCRNCLQRSSRWASRWCAAVVGGRNSQLIGGLYIVCTMIDEGSTIQGFLPSTVCWRLSLGDFTHFAMEELDWTM